MLPELWRRAPNFARRLTQMRQQTHCFERSEARIRDLNNVMIVHELRMLHALGRIAEGLSRDIAVSEVNPHPLVEGSLLHLAQNQVAQRLTSFCTHHGSILE